MKICTLTEDDLQEKIHIDVPMPVSYVSFRLVEELELLEPFGTGNSKPVFAQKDLKFVSARALGKAGNVLVLRWRTAEQKRWEMMYFGGKDNFEAYAAEKYGQTALDGLYSGKGSPLYFDVVYLSGRQYLAGKYEAAACDAAVPVTEPRDGGEKLIFFDSAKWILDAVYNF